MAGVAIVTGGGSGIGAATVRRLAAAGAHVAVVDRDGERAAAVAAEVHARALVEDVSQAAAWERIIALVTGWWGPVSMAHLNAGVPTRRYPFVVEDVTDAEYERIRGVNFDGVLLGTRAVVPSMAAGGGGAIVVTASVAGLVAFPEDPYYAATKHGIVGFVRSAAPQLASKGVRINALCPSVTDTAILDDERRALIARERRVMQPPDEVAEAVVELLTAGGTGEAWTTKVGRGPRRWEFR
ncbi:MAG TPA: SDR family oxidoreductase [Acidimicrobiales bacterium]|nr:SDR family oxidoreductase [Acidimicrobiales bacterium]